MTILVKVFLCIILISFWGQMVNAITQNSEDKESLGTTILVTISSIGLGVFCGWLMAMVILV